MKLISWRSKNFALFSDKAFARNYNKHCPRNWTFWLAVWSNLISMVLKGNSKKRMVKWISRRHFNLPTDNFLIRFVKYSIWIFLLIYRLSMISDNIALNSYIAITIIDKLKIACSDNDNDKNLSIDNYRR